jgi:peptidoglycan/LPS O-acetylase OafA/YrhL
LLWSVSVGQQFYLVWPFLLAWRGTRSIATLCAGMIVVATLTRVAIAALALPHPAMWTFTLARLEPIAVGALVALTLRGGAPRFGSRARWGLLALSGALLVGGVLVFGVGEASFVAPVTRSLGPWRGVFQYPLTTTGWALILLAVLHGRLAPRWLRARPLVYLGRISYGLYVFHMLCIAVTANVLRRFGQPPLWLHVALSLVLTTVLAALSYQILERPFLLLKERFTRVLSRPDFRDGVGVGPTAHG